MGILKDLFGTAKDSHPRGASKNTCSSTVSVKGSGNVVVVNGKVYTGDDAAGDARLVDETRDVSEELDSVEIRVRACDVSASLSDDGKAHVRFVGDADRFGVDMKVLNRCLQIRSVGNGIVFTRHQPSIYVNLPDKEYTRFSAVSASGDIDVRGISAEYFEISSASGDVEMSGASFAHAEMDTKSGDIDVSFESRAKSAISCKSMSGDVDVTVRGAGSSKVSVSTMSGDVSNMLQNNPNKPGNTVSIDVSTMSGDISIR